MKEARCIAGILRKKYLKLFEPEPGLRDSLPLSLLEGYRYRDSQLHKGGRRPGRGAVKRQRPAAEDKAAGEDRGRANEQQQQQQLQQPAEEQQETEEAEVGGRNKKLKEVYLVNKRKFHATATEEELGRRELILDSGGGGGRPEDEDVHRILQAKIRYAFPTRFQSLPV